MGLIKSTFSGKGGRNTMNILKTLVIFILGVTMNTHANSQQIELKKFNFTSNNNELVGNLYLPADYNGTDKLPTVIVTGAWTTVKEQMPKVYAEKLAEQGYAAFTFDFTGWGESEGANHYLEDPMSKTEDIKAAAEFLTTIDEVDASRIGGLGICASSGYMVKAYNESPNLKTIGLVATWLHNPEIATEVYGGEESVAGLIATSEEAQTKFEQTGELTTITAASTTDEASLMYQAPYYTEPDRGLISEYDNKFNLASWEPWLTFDAISLANDLRGPITFVHSEAAVIPHGVKQFAEIAGDKAKGVWLDNVTQFEFYDQPEPVRLATQAITEHFQQQL